MTPDPFEQPEFYDGVPAKRLLAWVVDSVIVLLMCLLALPFTLFMGIFFFPLMWLVISFCYRAATIASGSATWGMRLMGIELRDRRDEAFDGSLALAHTAGYAVSVAVAPLQLISIVLMLVTERKQGLSDMVLGSVAVNCRR